MHGVPSILPFFFFAGHKAKCHLDPLGSTELELRSPQATLGHVWGGIALSMTLKAEVENS